MPLLPAGTAVVCGGTKLLFESSVSEWEREAILLNKDAAILRLRTSQMNTAGFYTTFPSAIAREIRETVWVAIDLRTTAPSRFSTPLRLKKNSPIGHHEWQAYRALHPRASLSTSPRPRVLSIQTELLGVCAFDLDALSGEDRLKLFEAVLDRKIVVGHNLGLTLAWLFREVAARPAYALDSMLLVRQCRPASLLRPYRWAAFQDQEKRAWATDLLSRHPRANVSLEYLAACAELSEPNAPYRGVTAWCVTELSQGHLASVKADLAQVIQLIRFTQLECRLEDAPDHLRHCAPWYHSYQSALIRLAEAHVRGIAFDQEAAAKLSVGALSEVETLADALKSYPGFTNLGPELKNAHVGKTVELKKALAHHRDNRVVQETPNLDPKWSATPSASPATSRDPQELYDDLHSGKQLLRTIESYGDAARVDGRLHSVFLFDTATGRTTSRTPALQNLPRTAEYRSMLRARPHNLILSVDYTAMELYIATALVDRAIKDLRARLDAGDDDWFLQKLRSGICRPKPLARPAEPSSAAGYDPPYLGAELQWLGRTVLRRQGQSMATVLQQELDPHLVTAVDFARRAGRLSFDVHPVKWVASLGGDERERLRNDLAKDRRGAKAANFGLLYGMRSHGLQSAGTSNYGLSWTLEEATAARRAWLDLYPEFSLWHAWTKYFQSTKGPAARWRIWGRGSQAATLIMPSFAVRLYRTTTLTGRPLAVLNDLNAALSHQSQGTGADILAQAIADLPVDIANMLLMPVHDELVFEVPTAGAEAVKKEVERVMVSAADRVLQMRFPIQVKSFIGPTWS